MSSVEAAPRGARFLAYLFTTKRHRLLYVLVSSCEMSGPQEHTGPRECGNIIPESALRKVISSENQCSDNLNRTNIIADIVLGRHTSSHATRI